MKYFFSIAFLAFIIASCADDDTKPTAELKGAPAITSPAGGGSYTFDEAQAAAVFEVFKWTTADFGYQAAITYKLEVARAGNNFANALTLNTTSGLEATDLTIGKLNSLMIAVFGVVDTLNPTPLEFRVCASVTSELPSLCSSPITLNIVPFPVIIIYDSLSVPGNYQGWNPGSRETVVFARKNDEVYSGYIYFNIDGALYKFAKGWSWDMNWGDSAPFDGVLEQGGIGNNIPLPMAGMYYLTCDLNALKHTNLKTDWGVLGSATPTGTSADTKLTWDDSKRALTVTLDLVPGSLRFRANDDNAINFGDTFTNGLLDVDGDDIPVAEAGNYTIDLILTVGDYTYKLTKN